MEDVAAQWIARFDQHKDSAVADLTNFIFRASGSHAKIDEHDVADTDNCANKLGEIQDDYQQVGTTAS